MTMSLEEDTDKSSESSAPAEEIKQTTVEATVGDSKPGDGVIFEIGKHSVFKEHWAKCFWRPGMAWLYMVICACDFVIFPVFWAILGAVHGGPVTQWKPITLEGAGLIHLAFGAILGVTAYGRSKEKVNGSM